VNPQALVTGGVIPCRQASVQVSGKQREDQINEVGSGFADMLYVGKEEGINERNVAHTNYNSDSICTLNSLTTH